MRIILRLIDSISEYTGKIGSKVCVVLVIVLCYEVTARYVFNAPTLWAHEVSCMLGLTIVALGLAYTHLHHGHVRVDVLYIRFSPRGRAIIDVACTLLLFFPLIILLVYIAADRVWFSFSMDERLMESFWYPPAAPIRIVLFLGLSLFVLQGIAQFTRDLYFLIRNKSYD